ncbi:DUF4232 domain-containing protein [Corynebacterium sp. A21]|uniref:DUF4232 domain-containing protein n=1 Tax=Corynebacterium sp. A21 TaxID=3457318 RepID=UPI003FD28382
MSHLTSITRRSIALFGIGCAVAAMGACSETGPAGTDPGDAPTTVTIAGTDPATESAENPTPDTPESTTPPAADSSSRHANCLSDALTVSVLTQQGAAGSVIYTLGFNNHSDRPCDLRGFPGVSFVGHQNGTQIGAPAVRELGTAAELLSVDPGETATAEVRVSRAENYDPDHCGSLVPVDGFRIYPPENTVAVFVPLEGMSGCTNDSVNLLSVKPLSIP